MEEVAPDLSMTEKSLQYLLAQPAVASVITGASKIEQLRENIQAANARRLTSSNE